MGNEKLPVTILLYSKLHVEYRNKPILLTAHYNHIEDVAMVANVTEPESIHVSKIARLFDSIENRIHHHVKTVYDGRDSILHGLQPASDAILLNSNDYLSLSGESQLLKQQIAALQSSGYHDSVMSPVFLNGSSPAAILENNLAQFLRAEAGVICQSGYAANVGLIQSIASRQQNEAPMPVYVDMKAHASIWDGITASGGRPVPFRHNDMNYLEREISLNGPGLICVDSVYSTTGAVCPLTTLVDLAERYDCMVLVDESHSVGTHGPQGAGLVVELGLSDRVQFRTFSLAKAFAGRGGFVTCPERFKSYFICSARPLIFSSCMLGHEIAYFSAALEFIKVHDDRRVRLRQNTARLRSGLAALGYNVSSGTEQIVSLEPGELYRTRLLRDSLQKRGVFGAVFFAPATAEKRTIMRFTVNSSFSDSQIDRVLSVCEEIRDEVDMSNWRSTKRAQKAEAE